MTININHNDMKLFLMRSILFFTICFSTAPLIGQIQIDSLQGLLNKKEYAKMIVLANNLTVEDSASYDVMYAIGQAYDGMLRYKIAYGYYDICYRMDTTNIEILNVLARSANNLGRVEDAEKFYLKVLEVDSSSFYTNNQLASFYYQSGKYDKALSIYQRLLSTDEENPALLTALGNCYIKMGDPLLAISNYFRAFNYTPENVALASTLINTMLSVGDRHSETALKICDTALVYNPNNLRLLQDKGMALYVNERYSDADTLYTSLMEAGDSTYITIQYCGLSRYQAGQFVASIEPLELAYLMDTTSINACLYLGSALGQTYDRKRAFLLFDKAEKLMKPSNAHIIMLGSFRADTHSRNREEKISSQIYYGLWKEYPGRMDLLSRVYASNNGYPFSYKQPEEQQIALFVQITFTKALLDMQRNDLQQEDNPQWENRIRFLYSMREVFEKIYDEMIFNEANSLPMLAPDGEKSTITMAQLRTLIDRLPNERPTNNSARR